MLAKVAKCGVVSCVIIDNTIIKLFVTIDIVWNLD